MATIRSVEIKSPVNSNETYYFVFAQNNSGGFFEYSEPDGIGEYVVIEAHSARMANDLAERIGLRFDGEGDCPCCGDRWYRASDDDDRIPIRDGLTFDPPYANNKYQVFAHLLDGSIHALIGDDSEVEYVWHINR